MAEEIKKPPERSSWQEIMGKASDERGGKAPSENPGAAVEQPPPKEGEGQAREGESKTLAPAVPGLELPEDTQVIRAADLEIPIRVGNFKDFISRFKNNAEPFHLDLWETELEEPKPKQPVETKGKEVEEKKDAGAATTSGAGSGSRLVDSLKGNWIWILLGLVAIVLVAWPALRDLFKPRTPKFMGPPANLPAPSGGQVKTSPYTIQSTGQSGGGLSIKFDSAGFPDDGSRG